MIDELGPENAQKIALVLEFAEYRCRCTTHGITEVDAVDQIGGDSRRVDDDIHPFGYLPPRGKHQQYHVGNIGDEDSCRVEDQSSLEDLCQVRPRQTLFEITVVHQQVDDPGQEIQYVGNGQIAQQKCHRRKITQSSSNFFYLHFFFYLLLSSSIFFYLLLSSSIFLYLLLSSFRFFKSSPAICRIAFAVRAMRSASGEVLTVICSVVRS